MTFTKLFSSITESTVWVEPYPTRIAWVSMLANADRKGRIFASVPGLAKLAGITLPEIEAALACFMAPDRYSRTKEHDGIRIEEIDGGWRLLNYEKYRELRDADERREYQRNWDREHRGSGAPRGSPDETCRKLSDLSDSDTTRPCPTKAEADAEAEGTNNQSLKRSTPAVRATRLPDGWQPDQELLAWTRQARKTWDEAHIVQVVESFRDYWRAKAGKDGCKLDWAATWRNWVRKEPEAAKARPYALRTDAEWMQRATALGVSSKGLSLPQLIAKVQAKEARP